MRRWPWLVSVLPFLVASVAFGRLLAPDALVAQVGASLVVSPPSGTEVGPGQAVEFRLEAPRESGPFRFSLTWLDSSERIGDTTDAISAIFPFRVPVDVAPGQVLSFLAEAEGPAAGSAGPAGEQPGPEPFRVSVLVELRVRALPGGSSPPRPTATPRPAPTPGASPSPSPAAGVEEWEGAFSFQIIVLDGGSDVVSFGTFVTGEFTFTVDRSLDPSGMFGVIRGSGQAMRTTVGGRSGDCTIEYRYPPESLPISVLGTLALGRFLLVFGDPNPTMTTVTSICPGSAPISASIPLAADIGLHTFGIELAAEDGARFSLDRRMGSFHERGELTVRQRSAAAEAVELPAP